MSAIAYRAGGGYDEMFGQDGLPRPKMAQFVRRLESLADGDLVWHQKAAESMLTRAREAFRVVYDRLAGRAEAADGMDDDASAQVKR